MSTRILVFDTKKFGETLPVLMEASNGPKSLRSLILKLGLGGRLGTNRPGEPPPDVPLAGDAPPSVVAPHSNWVACHLPDVAEIEMGNSPPGASYNEHGDGVPLINGPVEFSPGPFGLTRRTKFTTAPARMCRRGDLLVCVRGATTGRTNVADFDACIGRGVALVRARANQRYLNYYMWSVGNDLLAAGTGTTFPAISRDDLAGLVVLLPPLAEQKRIVAKVDELMALLDALEAKQTEKRETQARLRSAALGALTSAAGPDEFDVAWKRVAGSFRILFERTESVGDLREVVLELASRGTLVSQIATEGTGLELFERIVALRNAIKSGSTSPETQAVADLPVPHPLPRSWTWASLEAITHPERLIRYGMLMPGPDQAVGPLYVKVRNMKNGVIDVASLPRTTPEIYRKFAGAALGKGDLLMSIRGSFGGVALVPDEIEGANITQDSARIAPLNGVDRQFLLLMLRGPLCQRFFRSVAKGAAVQGVNIGDLRRTPIPLPPLAEQKRIVAKVDHLMKLCDDLEAALKLKTQTASKLAEAVVTEMVQR